MEEVLDAGAVILGEIAGLEAERARVEARLAGRMLDFADLRRRESESAPDPVIGKLEASFAADELSVVLLQSTMSVQHRLAEARRVRGLLPRVWAAWRGGVIDQFRVRLIAEAVDRLQSNWSVIELDDRVVGYAASHAPSQVRAWLRRFVARAEPDRQDDRAKDGLRRRCVYVAHDDDGVSWVHALVPTTAATRIDALLASLAKAAPAEGVTLEQRRADLFADLLLGRVDQAGVPTGRSRGGAVIGVTVPLSTLCGFDDMPGESVDRRFVLPAAMVRELAAEPGTLFYRLLTDPLGRLLDVTEIGRFPSRRLRHALDLRDGVCAFPTCGVPARDCDADHDLPVPRGPTTAGNLKNLCRRHHRMKTFGIVETGFGAGGHRWRLPGGTVIDSETQPLATGRLEERSVAEYDFATFLVQRTRAA